MQLLTDFPRIRAWFSGHFHLSHNYADSIVGTAGCAFVQTGVIGPHCNRDGERHSRLLRLSPEGCKVQQPSPCRPSRVHTRAAHLHCDCRWPACHGVRC